MKKLFLTAICLWAGSAAFAQDVVKTTTTTETNVDETVEMVDNDKRFFKNWFVTLAGGGQMYVGDHDKQCKFGDRIAGNAELGIGKWISPVVGVRMMYSGFGQKGATKKPGTWKDYSYGTGVEVPEKGGWEYQLQKQKFNFGQLHLEAMFNLCNLFAGYKPERVYNCSPYIGVGFAHIYDKPGKESVDGLKASREVSGNIGLYNSFRLSSALDFNLDIRGMYVHDRFDGEVGGRWGEGNWTVSAGFTYKFKKRGFGNGKVITRTINNNKYTETQLAQMRDEMNRLMAENQRMQAEIEKGQNTVTKQIVAAPNLIVFEINKSELSNEARVNLGMFAELIKACDKDAVYTISGYADKGTGSSERNEVLSKERAQAVYDCLVKEFGVSPKQLKMVANGGVDNMYYDDPRLSRAVINRIETK